MSTENQETIPPSAENEQITRTSDPTKGPKTKNSKTKDPKKVAAGKKLEEHKKKVREALNRELKREAELTGEAG